MGGLQGVSAGRASRWRCQGLRGMGKGTRRRALGPVTAPGIALLRPRFGLGFARAFGLESGLGRSG